MWWLFDQFRKKKFGPLALEILQQKENGPANTYAGAKFRLTRLVKHFGDIPLCDFTDTHWHRFIAIRLKERPGCKFFDDRKYCKQVLLEAVRRGYATRAPRLKIPDISSSPGRELADWEIKQLLVYASVELRFQIEVAYKMGLRLRELMYLRWDQFDWARKTIKFSPADVKTRRGREVPITPDLLPRFRRRHFLSKSPYVFPRRDNPSLPRHENKTAWRLCKQKAGIKARWHDLRHTAASQMLRRGNSLRAVSKYLGMSQKVLIKIYDHLNIEDLRRVANRMSRRKRR